MPSIIFSESSVAELRNRLKQVMPEAGSSHIAEATASGLGFSTNAAMVKCLKNRPLSQGPSYLSFEMSQFCRRAAELGLHIPVKALSELDENLRLAEMTSRSIEAGRRTVPPSMNRAKKVVHAIRKEFGLSEEESNLLVADLHGFSTWADLEQAVAAGPADAADEQCESMLAIGRRTAQSMVLSKRLGLTSEQARIALEMLAPTGNLKNPTLIGYVAAVEKRIISETVRTISQDEDMQEAMSNYLASRGRPFGNLRDGVETTYKLQNSAPTNPSVWLDVLEKFGWAFLFADRFARNSFDLIARSKSSRGDIYDIFLATTAYVPAVGAGHEVDKVKLALAQRSEFPVLMFNKPIFWLSPQKTGLGLLYGGQIMRDRVWHDFVLRSTGCIDDAIAQVGRFNARPEKGFVKSFGMNDAMILAFDIAIKIAGLDENEPRIVESASIGSGWELPVF